LKMGTISGPVPVKLVSFNGSRQGTFSKLQWVTANEDRGDAFDIERSVDGINFQRIATVNSNDAFNNHYHFIDTIAAPLLYYRIKISAASGNSFYSNIIVFKNGHAPITGIRLLQNPVRTTLNMEATVEEAGALDIFITDVTGKKMMERSIAVNEGINQFNISLPFNCSNGIYILNAVAPGINKAMRFMVVK